MKILIDYDCVIRIDSIYDLENLDLSKYKSKFRLMSLNAKRCYNEIFSPEINLKKFINMILIYE